MTTAVPRRSGKPCVRRRVTAWLAALVLALNVLAPVLINGPAAALAISDPLSGQMVICTPSGMRIIGLDGESRPLADPTDGDIQLCAFCLPLVNAGLGALSAGDVVVPPPSMASAALGRPGRDTVRAAAPAHRLPEARAPPVLLV